MDYSLDLHSPRVHKARYAATLRGKGWSLAIPALGLLSVALGIFLLFSGTSLGYIALMPAIVSIMLGLWNKGELGNLESAPSTNGAAKVADLMAPTTLAALRTDQPAPYDLWQALANSPARYFFQNRYLLPPNIFEQLLSREPGAMAQVWEQAEQLRQRHERVGYENSLLLVALLKTIPNVEQILREIQLEIADIEEGIDWMGDIKAKRELARRRQWYGGLARDWAYGYTPLLRYLGHNMTEEIQASGFFIDTKAHDELVNQMVQALGSGGTTTTLVGDIGVGKTTTVYAFAERLIKDGSLPERIRYHQVISLDAPSLLSQASGPGELESLMLRLLNEAQRAKNMILFFDDAQVFFSSDQGATDLSNVLQPALESGALQLLFAMTPGDWQQLSARNATIAARLQAIQVQPADEQQTIHVLRDEILSIEYQRQVVFTYQALREAYHLGSRYVDTQAMPGAALGVLKGAANMTSDGLVTEETVQHSIESSLGVKLGQAREDESHTLLNLEAELGKQVISQRHAISVISNALRRARSGVGNPERPIGTFLFLGPTGVGKTELSKALARTYFGNKEAMVRVDMNQYVQPSDVNRLITPMLGDQLGFLGQVRRQPFSVILLDEIEKAHPQVVNLLLQTLDEGVMRDVDNKPVSFKDAIIIATSNAGADEIRRMIEAGEDVAAGEAAFTEKLINDGHFAPEFINRFDEVVLFAPLTADELVQVIDLIIAGINRTLDHQKVQVGLSDAAKRWLVERGYDSRLGARPMRRMAQRYVENILAKRLLDASTQPGSTIQLDVLDFEQLEQI